MSHLSDAIDIFYDTEERADQDDFSGASTYPYYELDTVVSDTSDSNVDTDNDDDVHM